MPAPAPLIRPRGAVCAMAALLGTGAAAVALDAPAPGAGPLAVPVSFPARTGHARLRRLTVGAGAAGLLLPALCAAVTLRPRSRANARRLAVAPRR